MGLKTVHPALDEFRKQLLHLAARVDEDELAARLDGRVHLADARLDELSPQGRAHDQPALLAPVVAEHHGVDVKTAGVFDQTQVEGQQPIQQTVDERRALDHRHQQRFMPASVQARSNRLNPRLVTTNVSG